MYLLNDKHSKYEYVIYVRCGTAIPYLNGKIFTSYNDVCNYLEEIAKRHQRYNRIFYIDNKFYKNECERDERCIYYKILRRPVSDWEEIEKK